MPHIQMNNEKAIICVIPCKSVSNSHTLMLQDLRILQLKKPQTLLSSTNTPIQHCSKIKWKWNEIMFIILKNQPHTSYGYHSNF